MLPKVNPFECYKSYLGLKNHFTKESYDYHKYCGKSRASIQSFHKRKDRYFFERLSRQKDDKEVVEYFVSNFVRATDPASVWIGEIVQNGESNYQEWLKQRQSMTYLFKEECGILFDDNKIDDVFDCSKGHPLILKKHLSKEVSLETLIIIDRILNFRTRFDSSLKDPVWESISMKLRKYSPFLHIDIFKYKRILRETVVK